VVGDNIDTDQIIPAHFLTLVPTIADEYEKFGSHAIVGLPEELYTIRFIAENEMKTPYRIIVGKKTLAVAALASMRRSRSERLASRGGDCRVVCTDFLPE
jgi:hypothetical protein